MKGHGRIDEAFRRWVALAGFLLLLHGGPGLMAHNGDVVACGSDVHALAGRRRAAEDILDQRVPTSLPRPRADTVAPGAGRDRGR